MWCMGGLPGAHRHRIGDPYTMQTPESAEPIVEKVVSEKKY